MLVAGMAGQVVALLDRHRQSVQRAQGLADRAGGARGAGSIGARTGRRPVLQDHRTDAGVRPVDPVQEVLQRQAGAQAAVRHLAGDRGGRLKVQGQHGAVSVVPQLRPWSPGSRR